MRLSLIILCLLSGIILGAVILPFVMFGLFQVFASFGGDIPQLLLRFESLRGTRELWIFVFYGVLGGSLGGLTSYFLLCLQNQDWQNWARFCLAVVIFPSFSLVRAWLQITTDGYNTVTEAVALLWLPTIWCIFLLAEGLTTFKRFFKQVQNRQYIIKRVLQVLAAPSNIQSRRTRLRRALAIYRRRNNPARVARAFAAWKQIDDLGMRQSVAIARHAHR